MATSAQVSETPRYVSPEAEDAKSPGRGSRESDTDPFGSPTFGGKEPPEDHSMYNMSDDESSMSLTDEDENDVPTEKLWYKHNPNIPKKRPGIKIASSNMRGRQKDGKDKMKMAIDWMRMNRITILALQETHILTEGIESLTKKFKYIRFYGSGLSTSSCGILFLVSEGIGAPQNVSFKDIVSGRIGALKLEYGDQTLNVIMYTCRITSYYKRKH